MARKKRTKLPAGVKRLRDRIERWRRTRAKRTLMPEELWSDAVMLAHRHGAYRVAQAARLTLDTLRRRMLEAGVQRAKSRPEGFVELTGAQILEAPAPAGASTEVELVDAGGSRLTVRLAGTTVDVAQLVAAFRQRSG
jgi:hypothetical protein